MDNPFSDVEDEAADPNWESNFPSPTFMGEPIYVYGGPDVVIDNIPVATPHNAGGLGEPLSTEKFSLCAGSEVGFGDDWWLWANNTWYWLQDHEREWSAIYANSTHPKHKPRTNMPESFERRVDMAFKGKKTGTIEEGMVLNITKIVSDTIRVPEGEYIVAIVDSNKCTLIPATEAGGQQKFEVFKPTLAGFFNPDIHKKIKELPDGKTIAETTA